MSSNNAKTASVCPAVEDDSIDALAAQFDCMTRVANLGTKIRQQNDSSSNQQQANASSFGSSGNEFTLSQNEHLDASAKFVDGPLGSSQASEVKPNKIDHQTETPQQEVNPLPNSNQLLANGHSNNAIPSIMPFVNNMQSCSPNDEGTRRLADSVFGCTSVDSGIERVITESEERPESPSTSTAKTVKVKRPLITRKQFQEIFLNHKDEIKEKSHVVFNNLQSLEKANVTKNFRIGEIELSFKLLTLFDGGIMIKVYASYAVNEKGPGLSFTSCVFLEITDVFTGRLAMDDAVALLPNYIDGSISDPVSEYSIEFLNKHFIFKNEQLAKRFERYSLFCRLCEQHVLSPNMVLDHLRSNDHQLLQMRFWSRFQLCTHWNNYPPVPQTNYSVYITNLGRNLQNQVSQFHGRCKRFRLNRAFEALENYVDGYSTRFHLFGSYQSGLMTLLNPMVDCFLEIKRIDATEPTYDEKLEVFRQLPFQVRGRFETAFVGYSVRWETNYFNENLFCTFDPKARNAVLSSQLMALYMLLCLPLMHLALVFRAWATQMGILKPSNEFRVSGAIFDYMTIFFMQSYYGVPIINEQTIGCPIESFLRKPVKTQLKTVEPMFETYSQNTNIPPLPILFMQLVLFYGCGFNYQYCIQITSAKPVEKENLGFRTVKIVDAFNSGSNIFFMRPEHAYHLDNMIFYACSEFLHSSNPQLFRSLSVEFISGCSARDFGYNYLIFTYDRSKVSNLVAAFANGGLAAWKQDAVPRIDLKCQFCRNTNHTERCCFTLQPESIDGLPIFADMHGIFSQLIDSHFKKERIVEEDLKTAKKFIGRLESIIFRRKAITAYLQPFGSMESGFGTHKSDLDLCIKLTDVPSEIKDGIELLCNVGDALQAEGNFEVSYIFAAKVPILRLKYFNGDQRFKSDISFSNQLALLNTKMLATYASLDERVAPLGIAIKKWASVFGINDSASHTLSSYALTIMLIHFLQRIQPAVLPYLQDVDEFGLTKELLDNEYEIQFAKPDEVYMKKFRKNRMTLGELYIAFFDYFGAFDWQDQVVQIRSPAKLWKLDKDWHRSAMTIEDPFDLSHNLVAGVRFANALCICKCINIMQHAFRDPQSIFFKKSFNFDTKDFQLLKAKIQRNNHSGPVCHKCGEVGHTKSNCSNNAKPRKTRSQTGSKQNSFF